MSSSRTFVVAFVVSLILLASAAQGVEVWVLRRENSLGRFGGSAITSTVGDSGGVSGDFCTLPFTLPCELE